MRETILKKLLKNINQTVSGQEVSHQLGITRAAVWKHINVLRKKGYGIDAAPGGGYVLGSVADDLDETLIDHFRRQDWPVRCFDSVESTNVEALKWAEDSAPNGALVITRRQSSGRGRRGRSWTAPDGGIWMSSVLRTSLSPQHVQPYALLAAASVCQSIEQLCPGLQVKIKWPNDLLLNDKKLCGILTELSVDLDEVKYIIVGMGINANFAAHDLGDELNATTTTLQDQGVTVNRAELAAMINDRLLDLSRQYEQTASFGFLLPYYEQRLAWRGQLISVSGASKERRGILRGINESGALLLEQEGEIVPIISGEISVRRVTYDL